MSLSEILQSAYLFKTFTPEEISQLEPILKPLKIEAHQMIFMENDEASALFLVESGKVRITKSNESVEVAIVGQGGIFGELAYLDGGQRSASAHALEETHLLKISYTRLAQVLLNNQDLAIKFYGVLAKQIAKNLRNTTDGLKK